MSVSTAIAVSASVNSSIAMAEAAEAKRIACEKFVKGYANDTATTAEMRQYADCVHNLLPAQPMPDALTWGIKAAILIILAAMALGAYRGRSDWGRSYSSWGERYVLNPLMYGIGAVGAMLGLLLLAGAVSFLLT